MMRTIEKIQTCIPYGSFTDIEFNNLFEGSDDRRYSLVKRALAKEELIRIRKGLYCVSRRYQREPLNLYQIAQKIYGPSYVSFESALSYYGWIPEGVYTIASATSKRSNQFQTPLGNFSYTRVPVKTLFLGVDLKCNEGSPFYMARPLKALADYVYTMKKEWEGIHPLIHSLRIEEEDLRTLTHQDFDELEGCYRNRRVQQFLLGLKTELLR